MDLVELIYPEKRIVTHQRVIGWAKDAFANHETNEETETIEDAIRILEDLGHITVKRDGVHYGVCTCLVCQDLFWRGTGE